MNAPASSVRIVEMKINSRLIWDYSFSENDLLSEAFKKWYLARALSEGSAQDIRDAGGVDEVRRYFRHLHLPLEVERLWSWYLAIPGPRSELYGHLNAFSKRIP